jgi:hypothetical protein
MKTYVVWLQNNRTDVRTFLIQKITQQQCCHPQCTPLPDPYTAPYESSTVGSNAAGRFLIAHSVAFAFTAPDAVEIQF